MIWDTLPHPIFILAPMEDVTDTVFRQIISSVGRPALYVTEFTNVDGFFSPGHTQVSQRLQFEKEEKPLIAQIWGMNPENYYKAAQQLVKMGFDGIDINMGCPQKNVTSHGACAALINNHSLAKEIINATKEGSRSAGSARAEMPVSVKTRLGFKTNQREEWIGFLLEQDLPVLTIHGRTAQEMSAVPAHWDEIAKVVEMRNVSGYKTLIIGNGDVESLKDAKEKVEKYHVDGVMIGRGIFHNPWLFDEKKNIDDVTITERLMLLQKHVDLYKKTWGDSKPFQVLKKYFKIYVADFPGAAELRAQLMLCNSAEEVKKVIDNIQALY